MSLRHQLDRAQAQGDILRRRTINIMLERMDIDLDSRVAMHVRDHYTPEWDSRKQEVEDVFNPDRIFEWLTEFTEEHSE